MAEKSYQVTYERGRDGWWLATVLGEKGVFTQGKNLAQARERIREALSLVIGDDAYAVELRDEIKLPAALRRILQTLAEATKEFERVEKLQRTTMRKAAQALTGSGMSLQDAGELLSVSRQRVHQILNQ